MGNQSKGAASSGDPGQGSTDAALSRTSSSTLIASGSGGDVACLSSTPTGNPYYDAESIDWEEAFKSLSVHLGREMLSSDVFFLVGHNLARTSSPDAARAFLYHAGRVRSRSTNDFMG